MGLGCALRTTHRQDSAAVSTFALKHGCGLVLRRERVPGSTCFAVSVETALAQSRGRRNARGVGEGPLRWARGRGGRRWSTGTAGTTSVLHDVAREIVSRKPFLSVHHRLEKQRRRAARSANILSRSWQGGDGLGSSSSSPPATGLPKARRCATAPPRTGHRPSHADAFGGAATSNRTGFSRRSL
jgi:hypothetical protein